MSSGFVSFAGFHRRFSGKRPASIFNCFVVIVAVAVVVVVVVVLCWVFTADLPKLQ